MILCRESIAFALTTQLGRAGVNNPLLVRRNGFRNEPLPEFHRNLVRLAHHPPSGGP